MELGEEGAIVTGSLKKLRRNSHDSVAVFSGGAPTRGGMVGILSLPVYAAIVMSGHQSSAILALIGLLVYAALR